MPRNKYPEETVQKILDAALHLFLEKGYEQTTILDIVENMGGMTRGAFYHHFKSKEEVLDALGDKLFLDNNPFEKLKQQTDLTGLEKLKYFMQQSSEDTDSRKISIMSVQALQSPAFLKKFIEDNRDIIAPSYQEIIEEGVKDGSIQTTHPKLLSQLLAFLTNFWTLPTIYPSSEEESIERLVFIKEITDKLGVPILDDEIVSSIIENAAEIDIE
ncbi:TetR family transcriptional regulator [Mobilisporobacter senegalensis]|uniref:TetR family transcriptional regulator n=1 Tax=Mobilisporobacter senegalensis TaxID=1329262 RepID=A0A3N1XL88_9FIRM|nr:TetR/AcrR family transcriptional regulator [Mobilisporobacter senegalensis]ROR25832.1 TetR family transcriptional regulator [Mobilisporobacter senegalensis]